MISVREYIVEQNERVLNIFDIDETLFKTKAMIGIVKDGKIIKHLNSLEYNHYKLKPGEGYDYGQFKNAKLFQKTSTPIGRMIGKLKLILRNIKSSGSKVILVTARSDFDDKEIFLNTFKANGIDIDQVYVERAGNLKLGSAAKNKRFIFHKYLKTGGFTKIRLFDDHKDNLNSFKSLAKNYMHIKFEAWLVDRNGKTTKF
jgi:hypothetical protein